MMKYVRHATKGFYLFTIVDEVMHLDVACSVGRDEIISAGFVGVVEGELKCFGESLSLGIKSLEEDKELLCEQLGIEPKGKIIPSDVCEWTKDGEYESGVWETECGQAFILNEGSPTENNIKFCCFCSKRLVEKRQQEIIPNGVCGVCCHPKEDSASCNRKDCPVAVKRL